MRIFLRTASKKPLATRIVIRNTIAMNTSHHIPSVEEIRKALADMAAQRGVSRRAIARVAGCDEKTVRNFLSGSDANWSTAHTLASIAFSPDNYFPKDAA